MRDLRATVKVLRSPGGQHRARSGRAFRRDPTSRRAREAGVDVDLDLDVPEGRLDRAIDAAGYRIVQESLTNVIRHSGARRATLTACVHDGQLELVITDDGRGRPAAGPDQAGTGLIGMQERIALLGGQLGVGNSADGGFAVRAQLPVRINA